MHPLQEREGPDITSLQGPPRRPLPPQPPSPTVSNLTALLGQGPQPDAEEGDTPESGKERLGRVNTGVRGMDPHAVWCCWRAALGQGGGQLSVGSGAPGKV